MNHDETPEIVGLPVRAMSTRRRVISLVVAGCVAVVVAFVAIPRLLDDTAKGETHPQRDATRKQLLRALGRETTARTDTQRVTSALELAFMADQAYPADVAALDSALDEYHRALAPGDSVAWHFRNDTDYVYCVEHRTNGKPDAYALYASTVGNVVETDHGKGCMKAPTGYAAAEATVAPSTVGP